MSVVRRRTLSVGISASLLVTVMGMAPIRAASGPPLPDPGERPVMPADVRLTQPKITGNVAPRDNRVHKLSDPARQAFKNAGTKVIESDEGILVLEVLDEHNKPLQIVAHDAVTVSGIEVIGLAFLDSGELDAINAGTASTGFAFGPQPVIAHRNGTNHSHYPGFPFHTCSYVYNWANGDSTFHMCAVDVTLLQYVATAWSGFLIGLFNPVLGFVAGLIVFGGIQYYKNNDGSIDLFGPAASINAHYGNTYYWGSRGGWYYHYPSWSIYYGWARRASNGLLYRTH